jgi:hypothetical protein
MRVFKTNILVRTPSIIYVHLDDLQVATIGHILTHYRNVADRTYAIDNPPQVYGCSDWTCPVGFHTHCVPGNHPSSANSLTLEITNSRG